MIKIKAFYYRLTASSAPIAGCLGMNKEDKSVFILSRSIIAYNTHTTITNLTINFLFKFYTLIFTHTLQIIDSNTFCGLSTPSEHRRWTDTADFYDTLKIQFQFTFSLCEFLPSDQLLFFAPTQRFWCNQLVSRHPSL